MNGGEKVANRKRKFVLRVPVTPEERALIQQKMAQLGTKNFSAYARKMLIDGYVVHIDTTDIRAQTAELQKPKLTREQMTAWFEQFRHGDPANRDFQKRLIDTFVNAVYVFDDKLVLTYNYQHGTQTILLEEIESALGSDFDGATPPMTRILLLQCSCYFFRRGSNRTVLRSRIPSVRWTVGKSACVSAHGSAPSDPLRLHQ